MPESETTSAHKLEGDKGHRKVSPVLKKVNFALVIVIFRQLIG